MSEMTKSLPAIERWVHIFQDYFLGFIAQEEFDVAIRALITANPELQDSNLRHTHFAKYIEPYLTPSDKTHLHILDPHRRRMIFKFSELEPFAKTRSVFRKKQTPDNCFSFRKSANIFDIRCFEEIGFFEAEGLLISRTFQPYVNLSAANVSVTKDDIDEKHPISEPTVLIIPKQTELKFYKNFPFTRSTNNDAILFSGEFTPVRLMPWFQKMYGLPCETALACVAYKENIYPETALSSKKIDHDYLLRVTF